MARSFHLIQRRFARTSLAFGLMVYREAHQLLWCVRRIRAVYPDAPVLVLSDGDSDSRYDAIATRYRLHYVAGERLKVPGSGAAYWKRFFQHCLPLEADVILKIDPDTAIHRRFRYLPRAAYFGHLHDRGSAFEHVQGGCQGFSRRAIRKLCFSGALDDPRYQKLDEWCTDPRLRENLAGYTRTTGLLNTDFMLHHMMRRIGCRPTDWPEAECRWGREAPDPWGRYAISHPHKLAPKGSA